jgi:acyl-CoA dehydrogenase
MTLPLPEMAEVLERLFADNCTRATLAAAEANGWAPGLWSVLDRDGWPRIALPEQAGGGGGSIADFGTLLFVAGRFAAPVPLAETGFLAGWALAAAGLPVPSGPATTAIPSRDDNVSLVRVGGSWRIAGRLDRVPWADVSACLVVAAELDGEPYLAAVPRSHYSVTSGRSLAGEPRDAVSFRSEVLPPSNVAVSPHAGPEDLLRRGAFSRAVLIAGALSRIAELTTRYVATRHQFGRPIGRFQAVQQHVVCLTEEAEQAATAVAAAGSGDGGDLGELEVAAAKIVASESAGIVAALAHQAHGAMGMTLEYELGQLTRRLWAWRDEFGSEAFWSRRIGAQLAAAGPDQFWLTLSHGMAGPP